MAQLAALQGACDGQACSYRCAALPEQGMCCNSVQTVGLQPWELTQYRWVSGCPKPSLQCGGYLRFLGCALSSLLPIRSKTGAFYGGGQICIAHR